MVSKRYFPGTLMLLILLILSLTGCQLPEGSLSGQILTKDAPSEKAEIANQQMSVEPGWSAKKAEKITLDWYVNFAWFNTSWGENLVSKKITEETGVDINFITPSGNGSEKLKSLIASDTLPDILTMSWSEEAISDLIAEGDVYALDTLADQYDLYWYQTTDPVIVDWYTNSDGHIYGYPNYALTPKDYKTYDNIPSNQTFLVRKDIYEAIGSPDMTTPEGFQAAVEKAAQMYPKVGSEPLIAVGAHEFTDYGNVSFDEYLANFLAIPYEKDGKFYDRYIDPELIRWLKMFRVLGEKGLLSPDIFWDKRVQMEEKIAKGRYFCMLYQYTDMADQQRALYGNDPDSIYIAVDGPRNSLGKNPTLPGMGINGWTVTMISKNCEYPDRAIQLFSYFMSEHGQQMTWQGVEGKTWFRDENVAQMESQWRSLLQTDRKIYDQEYGADATYWMFSNMKYSSKGRTEKFEPVAQLKRWTYPYVFNPTPYQIILESGSQEAIVQEKIDREWGEVLPQLLLADSEKEFNKIWFDFIQKRNVWGVSQVLRKKTELMNDVKAKMELP